MFNSTFLTPVISTEYSFEFYNITNESISLDSKFSSMSQWLMMSNYLFLNISLILSSCVIRLLFFYSSCKSLSIRTMCFFGERENFFRSVKFLWRCSCAQEFRMIKIFVKTFIYARYFSKKRPLKSDGTYDRRSTSRNSTQCNFSSWDVG